MSPRARRSVFAGVLSRAVSEEAPTAPAETGPVALRGSVNIRHVDAGSCNGCEIEVAAAFNPVYDAARYGARLVASPRHADAFLVTGVVTAHMAEAVRRTIDAAPEPRVVVACGDCAVNGGVFTDGYNVVGPVSSVATTDLEIPGCPPTPDRIVDALRRLTSR